MLRRRASKFLLAQLFVMLVLPVSHLWASDPVWMSRPGTIQHALSLEPNSHVYIDAAVVDKVKSDQNPPYFTIREMFSSQDRLVVLTTPGSELRLGQTIDVEGTITELPNGSMAIVDPTVWGYTNEDGELLFHGPLIKGLLEPTDWDWMVDLTLESRALTPIPILPSAQEPNISHSKGPVYYPRIRDLLGRIRLLSDGDFIDLAAFECKPIVSTGVDQTYGNYFIMGEDVGEETLKVYYQTAVDTTDRINKVSGQLREESGGQVLCVNSGPGYDPQVYEGSIQTVTEGTIAWAKTFPDGTELPVALTDKIVSAYIYPYLFIEDSDRSSAIGVPGSSTQSMLPLVGKEISIPEAWVATHGGERVLLLPPGLNIEIGDNQTVAPLGMPNRSISGGAFNVLTPGATNAFGLNNVGLLVKTWGRVISYDSSAQYIYITDGSDSAGIKVDITEYYGDLDVDDYVAVTGISRLETDGEDLVKRIDLRDSDGLQVMAYAQPFMYIAVDPGHGMTDDEVTITFYSKAEIVGQPSVTVNGHSANYYYDSDNYYNYTYTIQSSDSPGWATITVSGTDVNGCSGSKSSTSALYVMSSDSSFDNNGNRTQMRDSRGITHYYYDVLGRLIGVVEPDGKWIYYEYDLNSNRTKMWVCLSEDPSVLHMTDYVYNNRGLLWKVYDQLAERDQYDNPTPNAVYTGYTYDDNGSVSRIDYPNETYTEFAYDDCGLLTGIQNKKSDGTVIAAFTYEHTPTYWGKNGTRTAMTENILKPDGNRIQARVDYEYDDLYRLTREYRTGSLPYDKLYTYDPAGNRLSKTENSTPTYYTYNDANKMLTAGAASFTYDDAGNMLTRTVSGVTTNFTWDQWNALTQYQVGVQPQVDFVYNGDGLRVGKASGGVSTQFLLDGTEVAEEITGSNITSYIRPGLISTIDDNGRLVFYSDGMGSTRATSNAAQAVTDSTVYDAYGNLVFSYTSGEPSFGYAGQSGYYSDNETGLQYLKARYYDPEAGRFIAEDPIGYLGGTNLYAYLNNDPLNAVDPYGLSGDSQLWYDRLSSWVSEKVDVAKDFYAKNTHWIVAGTMNSAMDLVTSPAHAPSSVGHLGEAAGQFWAEPTLDNAGGAAGDVATFSCTLLLATGAMSVAKGAASEETLSGCKGGSARFGGEDNAESLINASLKRSKSYHADLAGNTVKELDSLSKGKGPIARKATQMLKLIKESKRLLPKQKGAGRFRR